MKSPYTQPFIEQMIWQQVRNEVLPICSELTDIVDAIDPSSKLDFIKIRYPFGSKIIDEGVLNVPTENGNIMPITDSRISPLIRNKLTYNLIPLGFIAKNGIEVFGELDNRIFSVAAWRQGLDIGIWEYFDWRTPYAVTAGGRSFYLLPKVSLAHSHKKLKRFYNVTAPPPKQSFDHWNLFRQVANSPSFTEHWTCEVIYFTDNWIKQLSSNDRHWDKLHNYILTRGWLHSDYARKKSIFDIIWQVFSRSLYLKGLKTSSYVLDTLKHLAFIGLGVLPASQPAIGSGILGPTDGIQQVYLDIYGLKDYLPTIMQPGYLSLTESKRPVYYSLQTPTLLESIPQSKKLTSIIDNIRELKELTDHFLAEAFNPQLKIQDTSITDIINQLQFEFFHEEAYAYGNDIRPSSEMPNKDPELLYSPCDLGDRKFADTSPYLHGCVRISTKDSKK